MPRVNCIWLWSRTHFVGFLWLWQSDYWRITTTTRTTTTLFIYPQITGNLKRSHNICEWVLAPWNNYNNNNKLYHQIEKGKKVKLYKKVTCGLNLFLVWIHVYQTSLILFSLFQIIVIMNLRQKFQLKANLNIIVLHFSGVIKYVISGLSLSTFFLNFCVNFLWIFREPFVIFARHLYATAESVWQHTLVNVFSEKLNVLNVSEACGIMVRILITHRIW